jgi:quercetin dioxygenase-like cupin family protein
VTIDLRDIPRSGWDPLPHSAGIVGRVLVREEDFFVSELRFSEHASVQEHPGERDAIVVCIAGEGFTSVGGEVAGIREEQQVRWPKGIPHRVWTEGTTMTTLMIEGAAVDFGA